MVAVNTFDTGSLVFSSGVFRLTERDIKAKNSLLLFSDNNNSGVMYIGNNGLTIESNSETDGFPLSAGSSLTLNLRSVKSVFLATHHTAEDLRLSWVVN